MVANWDGAKFDAWLFDQAEKATRPCEPEVIHAEKVYEAPGEYSMDYTYNCEECDNNECEYYYDYHEKEDEDESIEK